MEIPAIVMTLSTVRCQILGKAEIHTRGIRINPETEVQFGLAMYFCAHAGRQVPRDEVARLFWPDTGIEAARHNLRQSLYRLRVLGVPVRSGAKSSLLETHMVDADYAPVVAEGAPASVYMRLADVAVLPGYSPKFSRPYARWVEEFRTDVGTQVRRGLVRAISEMRARGRYADVERLCRFCLVLDPLNEEATLALAESVALAGGKVEAVGMIERYAGEVARYPAELRLSASLLRERISDRLIRRSQAQVEMPMIGREEDVERVIAAYQRLKGNRAVSYIVRGASGVGKTRLAMECCRIAELQGARVITVGTQPSSRTQALFAISELVEHMLQLPGAIGCAPAALDCLRAMSAPLTAREPRISMETDGEARFAMVRWSILDVIDAILSEGPLLLHIDDAHQMDPQSQLILQDALQTHANRPLLLLTTMRPWVPEDNERFDRLASVSTVHDLEPLSDDSCDRLVHRFCAANEEVMDEHTRERIIQLSGGNPFFLLELLKHRSNLTTDELPVSVQALLEDRLAKLSPKALTVLRAAAVLGLSSNVERLHRLVERKTSDVLAALTELHRAGMLSTHDTGTICRHDSIRDAVLERTPVAAKRLLHRRAAKLLGAEVKRGAGVSELWDCLHHWKHAGLPDRGASVGFGLSQRLLRLGVMDDAVRVLAEIERLAKEPRHLLRAVSGQIVAAKAQRRWEQLQALARRWRDVHTQNGFEVRPHSRIELFEHEARFHAVDSLGEVSPQLRQCIGSSAASDSHRLAAALLLMIAAHNTADSPAAGWILQQVQGLNAASRSDRATLLTLEAIYHGGFGDQRTARQRLEEMVGLASTIRNAVARALILRRASYGLLRYGARDTARELLLDALGTFRRVQLHSHAMLCVEQLGQEAAWDADVEQGLRWINEADELALATTEVTVSLTPLALRIVLAFETQDRSLLPSTEIAESKMGPFLRVHWARQFGRSLQAAHRLLTSRPVSDAAVAELAGLHKTMGGLSDQDFPTAVLAALFLQAGEQQRAQALLSDYLNVSRRDKFRPLIPSLVHFAAAANVPVG